MGVSASVVDGRKVCIPALVRSTWSRNWHVSLSSGTPDPVSIVRATKSDVAAHWLIGKLNVCSLIGCSGKR
jgi:hypothetical protein